MLLGEASYGLYLLQMPLFQALGGKYEWSAAAMLGFFALLVALSLPTSRSKSRRSAGSASAALFRSRIKSSGRAEIITEDQKIKRTENVSVSDLLIVLWYSSLSS